MHILNKTILLISLLTTFALNISVNPPVGTWIVSFLLILSLNTLLFFLFKESLCSKLKVNEHLCEQLNRHKIFIIILINCTIFILFSSPFLQIPYDPLEHLNRVYNAYRGNAAFMFFDGDDIIQPHLHHRGIFWANLWAFIFKALGIQNVFVWAKIIHCTQFLLSFFSILYFSLTVYKILLPDLKKKEYFALFSTLLWFIGNGCSSIIYHQSWINWYSLTYQGLAMPLMWYITALTLQLTYTRLTRKQSLLKAAQILLIFPLMTLIHPVETPYYLIFVGFLVLFHIKKSITVCIKYWYISISALLLSVLTAYCALRFKLIPVSKIFRLNTFSIHGIIDFISKNMLVTGSRFPHSHSELLLISIPVAIIILLYFGWQNYRQKQKIEMNISSVHNLNLNLFLFLSVTTLFFTIIPIISYSRNFFSIFTGQVWRFVFAAPWFFFLPLLLILFCSHIKNAKKAIGKYALYSCFVMLLSALVISKLIGYHALYDNTISILRLQNRSETGLNYSDETIKRFEKIVNSYPVPPNGKKPLYYVRGDFAFIARMIFHKDVYATRFCLLHPVWHFKNPVKKYKLYLKDPRKYPHYKGYKKYYPVYSKYQIIDIDLPKDFPKDKTIFRCFPGLEKLGDLLLNIHRNGSTVGELCKNITVAQSFTGMSSIARIQLLMANYSNRKNTEDIYLRIKTTPTAKTSIAELKVNASEIKDNQWHTFKFPDYLHLDPKKTYYITITSPDSHPGNAVTLYKTDKGRYSKGCLYINGKKQPEDLCMKIWKGY